MNAGETQTASEYVKERRPTKCYPPMGRHERQQYAQIRAQAQLSQAKLADALQSFHYFFTILVAEPVARGLRRRFKGAIFGRASPQKCGNLETLPFGSCYSSLLSQSAFCLTGNIIEAHQRLEQTRPVREGI